MSSLPPAPASFAQPKSLCSAPKPLGSGLPLPARQQCDKRDRNCDCCATKHTDAQTNTRPLCVSTWCIAYTRSSAQSKPGTTPVMMMKQHQTWGSMQAHKAVIPVNLRPGSPDTNTSDAQGVGASAVLAPVQTLKKRGLADTVGDPGAWRKHQPCSTAERRPTFDARGGCAATVVT